MLTPHQMKSPEITNLPSQEEDYQEFQTHLIGLRNSFSIFLKHLNQNEPFSYIRLADSDVLGWLASQKDYSPDAIVPIDYWLSMTGLSTPDHFPQEQFLQAILDADLVGIQQPKISPKQFWQPTLELLKRSQLLNKKQWIDIHTHCGLISYGHLFQFFIGKKVVWVGAKAPVFAKYFKNEPSYQKQFPQLHLNKFELLTIETPEAGQHAYESIDIIYQNIRACYQYKPDIFLFSTGLTARLLIPQVVKDGYTAIDMGAALDTLMNLPAKRPLMEIFSKYQHPNIVIDAPEHFWIETIREKETNHILFDRKSPQPIKLWDFTENKSLVDHLAWQQKMLDQSDTLEKSQNQILTQLQTGKPFCFVRFTVADVHACLKHYRPETEWPILLDVMQENGLLRPDSFEVGTYYQSLKQSNLIGVHLPLSSPTSNWIQTLEALQKIQLWQTRLWQPFEILHQLTETGLLFQQFAGKNVVWIGAKASLFKQHFYSHPAYIQHFPEMGFDQFKLTVLDTPELGQSNILDYHSVVLEKLQEDIYSQKPDIFLLSCGLLSRYLAPKLVEDGYTALDMGSILDSMMGLSGGKYHLLKRFEDFEHPDLIIHTSSKRGIDSVFCRETGQCLYNIHEVPSLV